MDESESWTTAERASGAKSRAPSGLAFYLTNLARSGAVALMCLAFASVSHADSGVTPLGELISAADVVALAMVRTVVPGSTPGGVTATLDPEQVMKGALRGSFVLSGNTRSCDSPNFAVGVRELVFLKYEGSRLESVAGRMGVIEVLPGQEVATAAFVQLALRGGVRAQDVQGVMQDAAQPILPRVLGGALLAGLSTSVPTDPSFATLAETFACSSAGVAQDAVLWGTHQAGRWRRTAARQCLLSVASSSADSSRRIAAVEALGDLGDPASADALLSALGSVAMEDGARPKDGGFALEAILALGKMRAAAAIQTIHRMALDDSSLALGSTAVHALGLIGGGEAEMAVRDIGRLHRDRNVRTLARRTARRIRLG